MALRNQLAVSGIAEQAPPAGASEQDVANLTDVALGAQSPASAALIVRHLFRVATEKPATLVQIRPPYRAYSGLIPRPIRLRRSSPITLLPTMPSRSICSWRCRKAWPSACGQLGRICARLGAPACDAAAEFQRIGFRRMGSIRPAPEFPMPMIPGQSDESVSGWQFGLRRSSRRCRWVKGNRKSFAQKEFEIPAHLSFFHGGHSGPPAQPNTMKNLVRLRAAGTGEFGRGARRALMTGRKINWDF